MSFQFETAIVGGIGIFFFYNSVYKANTSCTAFKVPNEIL